MLICRNLLDGSFVSSLRHLELPLPQYRVFTSKAGALLVNTDASFEQARKLFALTIAFQQDGDTMRARVNAKKCLQLLKHLDTAKETAAGNVVAVGNCIICEPSHLHTDTALQRFRSEGICV